MPHTTEILVRYPLRDGRIVLRTEADWSSDVEAEEVAEGGTAWRFRISTDRPWFYFKPCVAGGEGGFRWCVGTNRLAVVGAAPVREVYPYFDAAGRSTVSDIAEVADRRGGRHRIRVCFPPGYGENTLKRYPVLYMHDGANLFLPDEAFGGQAWEVDETLDLLDAMSIIDQVIVVGIYAGDRFQDFTKPGYEDYGRFLAGLLKPLVDGELRTLPAPGTTAVMGSSLGGVVSLFLAWQWPDVFGQCACLSSTFGFRDDLRSRIHLEDKRPLRIYLDSGWPADNYEPTLAVRDALLESGWSFGADLLHFAFPRAAHDERAWASRIHLPFQFLFGKTPPSR
jgi:predicted alpha/beta superfamily hydrolase